MALAGFVTIPLFTLLPKEPYRYERFYFAIIEGEEEQQPCTRFTLFHKLFDRSKHKEVKGKMGKTAVISIEDVIRNMVDGLTTVQPLELENQFEIGYGDKQFRLTLSPENPFTVKRIEAKTSGTQTENRILKRLIEKDNNWKPEDFTLRELGGKVEKLAYWMEQAQRVEERFIDQLIAGEEAKAKKSIT